MYCFVFNESATTEINPYWHTLSLHGALPICFRDGRIGIGIASDPGDVQRAFVADLPDRAADRHQRGEALRLCQRQFPGAVAAHRHAGRSAEHTSELQVTNAHFVCRLLLEKQKNKTAITIHDIGTSLIK